MTGDEDTGDDISIANVLEEKEEVKMKLSFCRFSEDGVIAFFEASREIPAHE